jgi:hypothetical protein
MESEKNLKNEFFFLNFRDIFPIFEKKKLNWPHVNQGISEVISYSTFVKLLEPI